jgi:hypothetical protein
LEERLRNGLESNGFSNIKADQLPLAIPQVAKAAKRSPNELFGEAFAFSIMGHNLELVDELISRVTKADVNILSLYPLHIATTYLDGSATCCNMLDLLCCRLLRRGFTPNQLYVNGLGHTVLDNLMIAILKGHTNTSPEIADDSLKRETRFAGAEVDLCGRWNADSPCFRSLLESGRSSLPFEWKHKICHTSVQTICHCIACLSTHEADLNTPSGLFLKYCSHCGQKLQLLPLHTLVLTAFQLAQTGCESEDLFWSAGLFALLAF